LRGYARHLVLEDAERLGLRHDDTKPVLLQDAIDGMWSEAFITSSIRLVVPVTSISVPEYMYKGETKIAKIRSFRKIWASGSADNGHERRWTEALYRSMLLVTF
jgi:branched-subunit amino acid aminotransferase/4-amino-4-deoxychorismate lyase